MRVSLVWTPSRVRISAFRRKAVIGSPAPGSPCDGRLADRSRCQASVVAWEGTSLAGSGPCRSWARAADGAAASAASARIVFIEGPLRAGVGDYGGHCTGPGERCVDMRCVATIVDSGSDTFDDSDADGDGIIDIYEGRDAMVDTDGDGTPDYLDTDSDNDGIDDSVEGMNPLPRLMPVDSDRDGVPDFRDEDSDGDGVSDEVEGTVDTDGDGRPDYLDHDSDGDGLRDEVESVPPDSGMLPDTDGDGTPDIHDLDSDDDGFSDELEGDGDDDGDGIENYRDPINDGALAPITLTAISTAFNNPIGIDYHEPTNSLVLSANYPTGSPLNFERIEFDGTHEPFSAVSGLTEEIKIGTVRPDNIAGFVSGDLFVGNGIEGQIVRITDGGDTVVNPWVDLVGANNGLMRGSLLIDRTGLYGGDLIVATTVGEVWRITADGTPTMLAATGVHLEGLDIVPNGPARFGPLSGCIIAGAEAVSRLYAIDPAGVVTSYDVGVAIEDIDIVPRRENFFGINYGTSRLLGAPAEELEALVGDIVVTQETHSSVGLYVLRWNGVALEATELTLSPESEVPGQWEHVTFAPAGVVEVPPII